MIKVSSDVILQKTGHLICNIILILLSYFIILVLYFYFYKICIKYKLQYLNCQRWPVYNFIVILNSPGYVSPNYPGNSPLLISRKLGNQKLLHSSNTLEFRSYKYGYYESPNELKYI